MTTLFKNNRYLDEEGGQKTSKKNKGGTTENALLALRAKALKRKLQLNESNVEDVIEKGEEVGEVAEVVVKKKKKKSEKKDKKKKKKIIKEEKVEDVNDEEDCNVSLLVEPATSVRASETEEEVETTTTTTTTTNTGGAVEEVKAEDAVVEQKDENKPYNALDKLKKHIEGGFQFLGDDLEHVDAIKVRRVLPPWLSNPIVIQDVSAASEKDTKSVWKFLSKTVQENLSNMGVKELFPVQERVTREVLKGVAKGCGEICFPPGDICVSAATGSGKTLAFAIPIVQALTAGNCTHKTQALVILPTRELAGQVYEVFIGLCKRTPLRCALVVGARGIAQERNSLVSKNVFGVAYHANIVVCTPGRLVDHLDSEWTVKYLRFLVIDEADRMMDFLKQDWLKHLEKSLQAVGRVPIKYESVKNLMTPAIPLQKLLFSATLSADPEKLDALNLFQPKLVVAANPSSGEGKVDENEKKLAFVGKYTTPVGLKEYMLKCTIEDKLVHALHLILGVERAICFTSTVETATKLATFVQLYLEQSGRSDGFKCSAFSSAMSQKERTQTMKKFKNKSINALICSDSAARGLDVSDVTRVIIYDVPTNIKTYIHRVGRTARAGKEGHAYTLLIKQEVHHFKEMLKNANKKNPEKCLHLTDKEKAKYNIEKVLPLLADRLRKN